MTTIVELFAVPVVLKAVDFLFGEARELMVERRKERQKPDTDLAPPPDIALLEQDKDTVLKQKVSQALVDRQVETIESLLEEIEIYQRNHRRLSKRVSLEGGKDFAPINVINQLHAQEDAILEKSQELAVVLDSLTRSRQ